MRCIATSILLALWTLGTAFAATPPWPQSVHSGGETTIFQGGSNAFSLPLANLDRTHRRQHVVGNSFFNRNWIAAPGSPKHRDGLGPLFNATSCSACHRRDGRGDTPMPGPAPTSLLFRLEPRGDSPPWGSQLATAAIPSAAPEGEIIIHFDLIPGQFADGSPYQLRHPRYQFQPNITAPEGELPSLSPRQAPPVFGLGLLAMIPEQALRERSDPDDRDHDGISGRLNTVWDVTRQSQHVGRFGWKAGQPTLRQQIATALLNDIGITSTIFPNEALTPTQARRLKHLPSGGTPEIDDRTLDRLLVYQETLAPPARRRWDDPPVIAGEQLFEAIGCVTCHRPHFQTGPHATIDALSHQHIWPYTDLLLHDMGPDLADYETEGVATPREWRTAPLWGIGLTRNVSGNENFLHDGRARTLEEAILWHGGEANPARSRYKRLSREQRNQVIAFLESL